MQSTTRSDGAFHLWLSSPIVVVLRALLLLSVVVFVVCCLFCVCSLFCELELLLGCSIVALFAGAVLLP